MAGTLYAKTALRAWCPAMTREERLRLFICESLRVPVRCHWIERPQGMFHGKYFTAKKLDFRDLENGTNQFVDRA
jgi:hypothetical protein